MAGYKRKAKTYTLKWGEGEELHGFEVVMKGLSVEAMLGLARLAAVVTGSGDTGSKSSGAKQLFRKFAGRLVSWNLEDDDGPVPARYAVCAESGFDMDGDRCVEHADSDAECPSRGVAAQDLDFVLDLVMTWMEAVASVGSPLPAGSSSGASSPEPSLDLASLSKSLSS